jgi:16S rRNA processing protein RimM
MMKISQNYLQIGTLRKPFGSNGFIKLQIDEDLEEILEEIQHLYILEAGHYLPYFIEEVKFGADIAIKFDEMHSPEDSKVLSNKEVFISDDQIDLSKYSESMAKVAIEGFEVIDFSTQAMLGKVSEILEYPAQTLAKVKSNDHEFLFPIVDDYLVKIDLKSKKLYVSLPEGLIDM